LQVTAQSDWVDLKVDDGTSMRAWVARPSSPAQRGLLVFQEAFGVNAHIRDVASRFAGRGFLAIAPDHFHRTAPGFEGDYENFPATMPHLQALTVDGLDADIRAAFAWLTAAGVGANTAAIGYCLGGRVAFLANSAIPLKAAASYYGGHMPAVAGRAPKLSGPHLFAWGGRDHHIPESDRRAIVDAVSQAGKPFIDVLFSNADHGFFCDARSSYSPDAAAQAWQLTTAFFDSYCPG
jgi:carboxymethylenebutenolidase